MGQLEIRRAIQTFQPTYAVTQSADGRYFAVGLEDGVAIYSLGGEQLVFHRLDMPVHQVVATPDFTQVFLATRGGDVVRLALSPAESGFEADATSMYETVNDLYTLALAPQTGNLGVGRLSFALAMLHSDGDLAWEQCDDRFAAEGSTWSVAFDSDGERLYVGSAGSSTNRLGVLSASSGEKIHHLSFSMPVTYLAGLPNGQGVALALNEGFYLVRLVAYDEDLEMTLWEHEFDQPITALSADPQEPVLAVAVGYDGHVMLLDAQQGQILGEKAVRSTVNDLSLIKGRLVAAVTQDKHLIRLRYLR
jgi:hypothetical protein